MTGSLINPRPQFCISPAKHEEYRRTKFEGGELLLTLVGGLGQCAVVPKSMAGWNAARAVAVLRLKDASNARFLRLCLLSRPLQYLMNAWANTTVQATLNLKEIRQLPVPWPPKHERRLIAHAVGTLDSKIELNTRMNETLEAIAQGLYKFWFIDTTQGGPPNGWHEGRFGNLTEFLGGYAFKSKDWIEQGVPVVKIGSVKPGIVDLTEVTFVSDQVAAEAKRFRLSAGDLLVGMTGYVGEVGLVPPTDNPPLLNQRVGKFVLEKPGTSGLGFLYCLTRRRGFKAEVEAKSHGTAQANVSAEGILSIPILVPQKDLRDKFNRICEPILNRILVNHAESHTLAALRDTLLPKLLSGEIRLRGLKVQENILESVPMMK